MEQQSIQRRRPDPRRFPVSSPDLYDMQQPRPISDHGRVRSIEISKSEQDAESIQGGAEDQLALSKRLQLRQTRFKGLSTAPRNITPTSGALTSMNCNDFPTSDLQHSSHSEAALNTKMRRASNDLGILQEVSNSSLRRKRSYRQEASTFFEATNNESKLEESTKLQSTQNPPENNMISSNTGSTIMANSSLPLRSDILKTPHARLRLPRTITPQRPAGTDSDKYIEHLESQLAALQTRLQALTSPSTSKTQSAKLRAVTSESRTLRQEVADWEHKFHDRIGEHLEQGDMVISSLKTQIKCLQRELESSKERLSEMAVEFADKDRQLMAAEGANYDLERRLEFMSEMLAISPSKIHPQCDAPVENRRISAPRPRSRGHAHMKTVHHHQTSSQRETPIFHQGEPASSPEDVPRKSMVYAWEDNPFDRSMVAAIAIQPAVEQDSTMSDGALSESAATSPGGRRSFGKFPQSDNEHKVRPTRRMRRFYTGSMGPRSLILPSATQAPSMASSPPFTGSQTALLTSDSDVASGTSYHFGFKLPISPERPHVHVRSATWDDNEGFASQSRKSATNLTPLPLLSPSRSSALSNSELSAAPSFLDGDTLTPVASQERGAQLFVNRDASFGSMQGRNLFEELSRIKRMSVGSRDAIKPTLSEPLEYRAVSSSELPSEEDNDNSAADTTLHPVLSSTHDLSLEPDNSCAIMELPQPEIQVVRETATLEPQIPKSNTINHQPIGLIDRLLAFVSRTLDVTTPSVSQVFSNAWSIVTLSRPVLEFRWWLVRLLVGGLRKRRRLKLLAARAPTQSLGISASPGLVSKPPDSSSPSGNAGDSTVTRHVPVMKEIRNAQQYNDHDDLDLYDDSDADDEFQRRAVKRPPAPRTTTTTMPKPVAWLRFSMTLVFAVGVAIRDGPASLFNARGPGDGGSGGGCADEFDDGIDLDVDDDDG